MTQLYRTQVLLERKQHEALQTLAAAAGRSMSEIIREVVADYLIEQDKEYKQQQWQEAMEELAKIREEIKKRHGIYPGDLVAEIREERANELWQRLIGEE